MSYMEPLCRLLGIDPAKLSKRELLFLEITLFIHIDEELRKIYREEHREYFRLIKLTKEEEKDMLERNYFCSIIRDIKHTEEYNMTGIRRYMGIYKNVVDDVYSGRNTNPSAIFHRKLIGLHLSVMRDLYRKIIKQIVAKHFLTIQDD